MAQSVGGGHTVSPSVAQLLGAAEDMVTCPIAPKLRLLLAASGLCRDRQPET